MWKALSVVLSLTASSPPRASEGPSGNDEVAQDQANLNQRARSLGFTLVTGSVPWSTPLLDELEAGLAALPAAMRAFPGGTLEFELHAEPAPFGMGDGSQEHPEWSEGLKRFHLYAYADSNESRAQWRLDKLPLKTRERLWRRRAIVHAVVRRWDEALQLARRKSWRALNGWVLPLERPATFSTRALNLSVRAYSRARGRASPELDFATFAEERFVPAESFDAAALPVDDTVQCQEFSKSRVLAELFAQAGVDAPLALHSCPAFEAWADLPHLSHWEVLLAQASGRQPESLFGHVLLRPVHRASERVRGPSFAGVIQLAAVTDPIPNAAHLVRGIFGGYRLQVFSLSSRDLDRELLEKDQRSVRRFALAMSPEQAKRVLQRAWELERRGTYDYQFFTDNCATGLVWLLQGALGESAHISVGSLIAASPAAVVDDLTQVKIDGEPLLKPLTPQMEASCARAERALVERKRALDAVRGGLSADEAVAFDRVVESLDSSESGTRLAAHRRLASFTHQASAGAIPALFTAWAYTVWVERCAADLAFYKLRELDLRAVQPESVPPFDFAGEVVEREAMFERESFLQRQKMVLDRAELAAERLARLPRRPLSEDERREKFRAEETLRNFDGLLALQAGLSDGPFSSENPQAFLDRDEAQRSAQELHTQSQSQGASGHWRASIGGGVWVDTQLRPVVTLRSSALLEQLGDQRQRGFHSGVALKVLDADVFFEPLAGVPRVLSTRLTVLEVRSLVREPALVRQRLSSHFGWGFELSTDYQRGRPLESRSGLSGELLLLGPRTETFRAFVTAGVGASAWLGWGDRPMQGAAGPHGVIALRLPLGGSNGLRAQAKYQWLATSLAAAQAIDSWSFELAADLSVGRFVLAPQFLASRAREGGQARPWQLGSVLTLELATP